VTKAAVLQLAGDEQNPYLLGLFAPRPGRDHRRGPRGRRRDPARPPRCVPPQWTQPALRDTRGSHRFALLPRRGTQVRWSPPSRGRV